MIMMGIRYFETLRLQSGRLFARLASKSSHKERKMNTTQRTTELEDVKINVKIKLSALWAAVMFLYVYADIKAFFRPGILEGIMVGKVGEFQITQGFLLVSAIIMTIPSVMIFLSLSLKAKANRWANIILGLVYTGIILGTILMGGAWAYYIFYGTTEILLTGLVAWHAWKWPEQDA
jgi:hypothetical protein